MHILIIEDDPKTADQLRNGLVQQGYAVDVAATAGEGDELATVNHHDVILLDVMLGPRDGIELCRQLRRQKVTAPILMLTALSDVANRVRGLNAGADDYLCKPFHMEELQARLRSLLRRSQATEGALMCSGNLVLDLHEHRVTVNGLPIKVSAKEFALLEYFMRNPRKLLTRTMISESVWDMNYEPTSNVIDVYVSMLRRKLAPGSSQPMIETVIGSGYRFVGDPRPTAPAKPRPLEAM